MTRTLSTAKFATGALKRPLFLADIEATQAKLAGADGLLKEYWQDFRGRCRDDAKFRSENLFLSAALGGAERDEACASLREYWRSLAAHDNAGDYQCHTWCRAGSVTRRIAFVDWMAARGAWSEADVDEAAESFLGYAFKHCYGVSIGRGRSSNNQIMSMTLNMIVIGFLFGYKHSRHATARFLFDQGFGRLPDLIGLFPADGYGGEGSTYTSHVNTPLAYWVAEVLQHLTGTPWLDKPFRPNGTTLRKMIQIEQCIVGPNGLLLPWDHYGWMHAVNASPFAYLARVARDPRYLSLIPALNLWEDPGYLAWGADDPMWTLIWWPEQYKGWSDKRLAEGLFGWCLPKTGAALDDCRHTTRLAQVWDLSSESMRASRCSRMAWLWTTRTRGTSRRTRCSLP